MENNYLTLSMVIVIMFILMGFYMIVFRIENWFIPMLCGLILYFNIQEDDY